MEANAGSYAIPYLCVLLAAVAPYALVLSGRIGDRIDIRAPRASSAMQTGWRQRSYWAHLNAFEAFAPFAAAVLMARLEGVPSWKVANLALAFLAARVLHGGFYLADKGRLRFLAFIAGCACSMAVMILAISRAA